MRSRFVRPSAGSAVSFANPILDAFRARKGVVGALRSRRDGLDLQLRRIHTRHDMLSNDFESHEAEYSALDDFNRQQLSDLSERVGALHDTNLPPIQKAADDCRRRLEEQIRLSDEEAARAAADPSDYRQITQIEKTLRDISSLDTDIDKVEQLSGRCGSQLQEILKSMGLEIAKSDRYIARVATQCAKASERKRAIKEKRDREMEDILSERGQKVSERWSQFESTWLPSVLLSHNLEHGQAGISVEDNLRTNIEELTKDLENEKAHLEQISEAQAKIDEGLPALEKGFYDLEPATNAISLDVETKLAALEGSLASLEQEFQNVIAGFKRENSEAADPKPANDAAAAALSAQVAKVPPVLENDLAGFLAANTQGQAEFTRIRSDLEVYIKDLPTRIRDASATLTWCKTRLKNFQDEAKAYDTYRVDKKAFGTALADAITALYAVEARLQKKDKEKTLNPVSEPDKTKPPQLKLQHSESRLYRSGDPLPLPNLKYTYGPDEAAPVIPS
jgi:chromosome segregation ATPase